MVPERTITVLVVATLLLTSVTGVGLVAAEDFPSATDGKIANGEELKTEQDKDDQRFQINYTFDLQNHQPGYEDGGVNHYAVGLTENGTLHRIKLVSDDFGFSNCEPDNSAAFGIDRGNDDPGTNTDKSLLTAFKSYESTQNAIDITFYKENTLAGERVAGDVTDQVVAAQNNCYDNPSEPGWYRINGTITGHNTGTSGTDTNYKIRDLSQWVYVCDCSSRAEAEQKLGPPPSDGGGDDDQSTATPTPSNDGGQSTATATPDDGGDGQATPTATPTDDGNSQSSATATPDDGRQSTATGTAGGSTTATAGGDTATGTATVTTTSGGGAGATTTGTTTASGNTGDGQPGDVQGADSTTPTAGSGPGFGAVAALGGLLGAALLALRRD